MSSSDTSQNRASAPGRPSSTIRRVLIVDDDPILLEGVKTFLEHNGYNCLTATNGRQALEIFTNYQDIEFILTDVTMPEMNGIELILAVRKLNNKVRIIVLSGTGQISSAVECIKAGANEFLEKPFMPIASLKAIREQESELIADKSKDENLLISELLIDLGHVGSISAQPFTERATSIITKISDFLNAEWAAMLVFKPDSNSIEFTRGTKKFEQLKTASKDEFLNFDAAVYTILTAELGAFTTRLVTENGKALGILVISKSRTYNHSKTTSETIETGLVNRLGLLFSSLRTQWLAGDDSHKLSDYPLLRLAMIGEVSSSLMHDIANPLSVVSSYSEILRKRTDIGPEAIVYVEKLAARVRNLVNIFNMFQQVNVIGSSKQKRDILADDIVRTATLSLENKISLYKVKISTDIAADLNVFCEPQPITQVVVNLISNAIDFSTSLNTEIMVRVTKPAENIALFEVSNYGPPIPKEIHDKIFTVLYTTKREGKGTGLGLYISKKFVKEHGGEINHRRDYGGRTVFYFTIKES